MFDLHQRQTVVCCPLGEFQERLFQELKHQTDVGTVLEVPQPSHNPRALRVQNLEVSQHANLRIKSRFKEIFYNAKSREELVPKRNAHNYKMGILFLAIYI